MGIPGGTLITNVPQSGCSDDGREIFVDMQNWQGGLIRLVFQHGAIGHLIAILEQAAASAFQMRATTTPADAGHPETTNMKRIISLQVMSLPDRPDLIFEMLTEDKVPLSVVLPRDIQEQLSQGLVDILDRGTGARGKPDPKVH